VQVLASKNDSKQLVAVWENGIKKEIPLEF
jgi:hypothetical protein